VTARSPILMATIFVAAGLAAAAIQACGGSKHLHDGGDELTGSVGTQGPGGSPGTGTDASVPIVCGDPGTPCCDSNTCTGGGCCVAGICMAVGGSCVGLGGGVCANGACGGCGAPGLPCCGSGSSAVCTAPQTKCNAGSCAKCGDLGGPCCTTSSGDSVCNDKNAICSGGVCVVCGTPGSPCCPGNLCQSGCCYSGICVGEASTCGSSGGICQAGRCSGCGSAAQTCCANVCYDNLICKSNTCTACGGSGQACCPSGGTTPPCQPGNACTVSGSEGVCARCGGLGDTCCAGNACTDGCCSGGRCISGSCPAGSGGIVSTGGIKGTGGIIATGGIKGTGGTISTGGCGYVIDNMEADTGKICQGNGRVGLWFTYIDSSSTSAITPSTSGGALPQYMSTPRSSSYYAMHMQGYYSTYAGMACWLNKAAFSGSTGVYNASGYTGITFWAKGNGNGGAFNVVGQMASTEAETYGGTCTASKCAGDYYTLTGLSSSSWKQYQVPFSYLTGGTVTPFDPTSTWSFEFQFYSKTSLAGVSFDLWIDDLSFY
jgi:hypothetical protein